MHDPHSSPLARTHGGALTPCPECHRRGLLDVHAFYAAGRHRHAARCLNCGWQGPERTGRDGALADLGIGAEAGPALPPHLASRWDTAHLRVANDAR